MTLQEQVCTLEQAQRLKELGCEQETSLFAWSWVRDNVNNRERFFLNMRPDELFPAICDAYTVAELGELLVSKDFDLINLIHCRGNKWLVYVNHSTTKPVPYPNEAQARAALLIHKIITNH